MTSFIGYRWHLSWFKDDTGWQLLWRDEENMVLNPITIDRKNDVLIHAEPHDTAIFTSIKEWLDANELPTRYVREIGRDQGGFDPEFWAVCFTFFKKDREKAALFKMLFGG